MFLLKRALRSAMYGSITVFCQCTKSINTASGHPTTTMFDCITEIFIVVLHLITRQGHIKNTHIIVTKLAKYFHKDLGIVSRCLWVNGKPWRLSWSAVSLPLNCLPLIHFFFLFVLSWSSEESQACSEFIYDPLDALVSIWCMIMKYIS